MQLAQLCGKNPDLICRHGTLHGATKEEINEQSRKFTNGDACSDAFLLWNGDTEANYEFQTTKKK
jgi:hypothetical protein